MVQPSPFPSKDDFNAYAVSKDRIATFDGQPRRDVALTRTIEAAALLDDHSVLDLTVNVPASPVFEACASAFARGTLISTVMGPVAIEDLRPGDLVETHRGPEPIVWKGSTSYLPHFAAEATSLTHLLRLPAEGLERGDLVLGPAARLVVRQDRFTEILNCAAVLAPAGDYVDGDRILRVTPPGAVQLYHIALRRHGILRANGHELESYHPGRLRESDLGSAHRMLLQEMFPHLSDLDGFGDLAFPRSSREAIDALRLT
ncbi:Hint domain-containing protein [Marivita sp. GX14005]|uniref:Hint domain-containing protein n=1 Tax=Marivita sp. GX14005 TaxID=2942276 RepID=UPI00201884CB|nr:Hint domain-containing protein [Marivita sp. GX14005]MCL3881256.1 Hint domain-containing protein [Marivita sp. GX14005]